MKELWHQKKNEYKYITRLLIIISITILVKNEILLNYKKKKLTKDLDALVHETHVCFNYSVEFFNIDKTTYMVLLYKSQLILNNCSRQIFVKYTDNFVCS